MKKTGHGNVGYPIITVAAIYDDELIKIACGGACGFPFRLRDTSILLKGDENERKNKIDEVLKHLPEPLAEDMLASKNYRELLLRNMLNDVLERLVEV